MDYMAFSDEIESIFTTKNLEKMPTAQVHGGLIIMGMVVKWQLAISNYNNLKKRGNLNSQHPERLIVLYMTLHVGTAVQTPSGGRSQYTLS